MIPGANILEMALSVIASQTVTYYKFIERSLNEVGQDISVFMEPQQLQGSFQPMPKDAYNSFGLDLQQEYFIFYVSKKIIDLDRDTSGDQLVFGGDRFQCLSNTEWYNLDGWKAVVCVRIPIPEIPVVP